MRNLTLALVLISMAGCSASTTGERELLISGYGAMMTVCRISEDLPRDRAVAICKIAVEARQVLRTVRPLLDQIDREKGPQRAVLLAAYVALREKLADRLREMAKELEDAKGNALADAMSDALYGYATLLSFGDVSELALSVADTELTEMLGE